MATRIVYNTQEITQFVMNTDDTFFLTQSGRIQTHSTSFSFFHGIATELGVYDTSIFVHGEIVAYGSGIYANSSSDDTQTGQGQHKVVIGSTGVISSLSDAQNAISLLGWNNQIINDGTLFASGAAINNHGEFADIDNSGTITSASSTGVNIQGSSASGTSQITNSGIITGVKGINAHTQNLTVHNFGTIKGMGDAAITVQTNGYSLSLFNQGTLYTTGPSSVVTQNGNDLVENHGTIYGLIDLKNGANIFKNHATLSGDFSSGAGNDQVTNTGQIYGSLSLGAGADTFIGLNGSVTGIVSGGTGDDHYIVNDSTISLFEGVNEGVDTVHTETNFILSDNFENITLRGVDNIATIGNTLANTMSGNAGDNWMRGLGGDDIIGGATGDDVLLGGVGDDKLYGGSSNDRLYGGAGNDRLFGGGDKDILQGDLGADVLFGGADEDTFLFTRVNHSPNGGGHDTIKDFERGTDLIDLSTFNTTFIGTAGFGAAAQTKVSSAGANMNVWVDTDGNGSADMRILVEDVTTLNIDDFLL